MTEPIARIEAALARLGAEHEPPVGWEARVLAATAKRPQARRWWWFALPAFALAAITLVVALRPAKAQRLQLALTVVQSGTVRRASGSGTVRGASASVGDVVRAAVTGGKHDRAVWVYRNDHLLVACPGAPQCHNSGDTMIAEVTLTALGDYMIIALTSSSALPVPTGDFDTDLGKVREANVTETQEPLTVR